MDNKSTNVIDVEWILIDDYANEVVELGNLHYKELNYRKEEAPDINTDMMGTMQQNGNLIALGAFANKKLIGYYINAICPSLFGNFIESRDIGIYISKDYRGHGLSHTMQEIMDAELKECGVTNVLISYPFERNPEGYTLKEFVYERRL